MKSPEYSIVIPVFNRADDLKRCIRSVMDQTFPDFEVIVVDDGSQEDIGQICSAFSDVRIVLIRQDNAGGGAARNRGIDAARGHHIAFLDSDDLFLPDKLECLSSVVSDDPNVVWYSPAYVDRGVSKFWVRPKRAIRPRERVATYLFVYNQVIPTPTLVVPTALARYVRFDESLPKGQDLDFCVRLQQSGAVFRMFAEPLVVWRDVTEHGRTSRTSGHVQPEEWLRRHQNSMTDRERLGYRATVLAYYLAKDRPFPAMVDIFRGWWAGVPTTVAARQAVRAFLPRGWYRKGVNAVVGRRGERVTL